MDIESIVNRYYRLITLTPGRKTTSLALLATVLAVYLLATSFPAKGFREYVDTLLLYTLEAALFVLPLTPLRRSRILNFKRSINLVAAVLLMTLPAEVVLSRVRNFRGMGLSVSPGLLVFVFTVLYELKTAIPLSMCQAVLVPLLGGLLFNSDPNRLLVPILFMSSASLVIGMLALYSVELIGRNRGISPLSSARAFMRTWLTGNHEYLEETIRSFGVSDRVRVRAFVFKREHGEPVAFVFPDIHFGPFRNVGSSRFLYLLEENLEPNMEVFVFHTPGSHERNLTASSESLEIARAIASSISSYYNQLADYGICKPSILKEGGWEAYVLRGPTAVVSFLTNVLEGNDDLPFGVWKKAEAVLSADRGLNLIAIVDSHAAKGPPVKDGDELYNLVEKLSDINECSEEEVYVGYSEAVGTACRELCYDKVKVLTLRFGDGEKYVIVYLYGNNVDLQTRNSIVNLLKRLGYKDPLIVTPDDHSCAASFKEKPYYVVSDCPGLYEAIAKAVERAAESASRARYVTLEHVFHDVELAGHNIWKLTSLIEDLGKAALRSITTTTILANLMVLPVVLSF